MTFAQCEQLETSRKPWGLRALNGVLFAIFCVTILNSLGCASFVRMQDQLRKKGYPEKAFEGYRDYVWAKRAYNLRYANCNIANEEDFRSGFMEGYCNVCDGGDGKQPAIPPNEYWGHRYQSENGRKAIQSWFRGFPEGARAARQDGAGQFKQMFISTEMKAALDFEEQNQNNKSTISAKDLNNPNFKNRTLKRAEERPIDKYPELNSVLFNKPLQPAGKRQSKQGLGPLRTDVPPTPNTIRNRPSSIRNRPSTPNTNPVFLPASSRKSSGLPPMIPKWNSVEPSTPTLVPLKFSEQDRAIIPGPPRIIQPSETPSGDSGTRIQAPRGLVPMIRPGQQMPRNQLNDQSQNKQTPDTNGEPANLFQVLPASWEQPPRNK